MQVQVLGAHNFESRSTRLVSLLIDGVLALDAGGLTSSLSLPEQENIKAILLTHRHYDHIRDIPAIAINTALANTIPVYAHESVLKVLSDHLLNGVLYPKFYERLSEETPSLKFMPIEAGQTFEVAGYHVLPVPVAHSAPTLGFQVTSSDGKRLFYTGDTGRGLAQCWERVAPDLLIIEVTLPNRLQEEAVRYTHLTPGLLEEEMRQFQEVNGYLPQVLVVHMNPVHETEILQEVRQVARRLKGDIKLTHEGMKVQL